MSKAIGDPSSGESSGVVLPAGPIESAPWGLARSADFPALLAEAFAGVELGAYDQTIIDWLAGWDAPTVVTVASLVRRARKAGGAL